MTFHNLIFEEPDQFVNDPRRKMISTVLYAPPMYCLFVPSSMNLRTEIKFKSVVKCPARSDLRILSFFLNARNLTNFYLYY